MNSGELGIWFLHSLAALCHREENASHHIMKNKTKYVKIFHLCAWAQNSNFWDVHLVTSNGFKHRELVHVTSGKFNDLENQPGCTRWRACASRVTQDTMWHHGSASNLISRSLIFSEVFMFGSSSEKFPGVPSHSRALDGHRLFLTCQGIFPRKRFIRMMHLSNVKNIKS